ncbi:MAG: hypothetical protein FWH27_08875 [Planctomycetaceae bacterium]|nr:hypothetical protein [Planctomycetaceae bacterium]
MAGDPVTAPTTESPLENGAVYRVQIKAIYAPNPDFNSAWSGYIAPEGVTDLSGQGYGATKLLKPTVEVTNTVPGTFEVLITDTGNTGVVNSPTVDVLAGYEVEWRIAGSADAWQSADYVSGALASTEYREGVVVYYLTGGLNAVYEVVTDAVGDDIEVRVRALSGTEVLWTGTNPVVPPGGSHSDWVTAFGEAGQEELESLGILEFDPSTLSTTGTSITVTLKIDGDFHSTNSGPRDFYIQKTGSTEELTDQWMNGWVQPASGDRTDPAFWDPANWTAGAPYGFWLIVDDYTTPGEWVLTFTGVDPGTEYTIYYQFPTPVEGFAPAMDAVITVTTADEFITLDAPVVSLGDLGRDVAGNDSWVEISWNVVSDAIGYEVHFFKGTDQNGGAGEWDTRGGPITFTKNSDGEWVGSGTSTPDSGWNNQMPILTESEGVLTMRCNTVFNGEKHEFYVIALATDEGANSAPSNHVVKGSQLAEPGVNVNPHNWFGTDPIETEILAASPTAGSLTVTYTDYDAWDQPWYLPAKPTGVTSIVQIATNDVFTAGLQTKNVANGTWDATFDSLAGDTYYVRVMYVTDDPDFFDSNWSPTQTVTVAEATEVYEYVILLENPADATIDGTGLKVGDTVSVWYVISAEDVNVAFDVDGVNEILPSVVLGHVEEGDGEWVDGSLRIELVFTLYQAGVNTFTAQYMAYDDDYNLITPVTVIGTCETITVTNVSSDGVLPETPSVIVTTLLDVVDEYDGLISLREAIAYASAGDTITFDASLYGQTITLVSGQMDIAKNITIDATGTNITIDADHLSRMFYVNSGSVFTLMGLTLENGQVSDSGGAISAAGTVNIVNATFTGNVAGGSGGAVYIAVGGTVTVSQSSFVSNTASYGGAIYVIQDNSSTTSTVSHTSFLNNSAASGGAIYQERGVLNIFNSLFARNSASSGGSAVHSSGNNASTAIVSSTVAYNTNGSAAVYLNPGASLGNLSVYNTVFASNSNNNDLYLGNGIRTLGNTIRSAGTNGVADGSFNILTGSITYVGFNTVENALLDTDGKPTFGSPTINRITGTPNLPSPYNEFDLAGNPRVFGGSMDVGAFEYQYSNEYLVVADIIDLNDITPVFDGTNWTFTFNAITDILGNDTYPEKSTGGVPGIDSSLFTDPVLGPLFDIDMTTGMVTFTWDLTSYNSDLSFTYKIGDGENDWSVDTTVTLILPSSDKLFIVDTAQDVVANDGLLSLREAIELSNTVSDVTTIIFHPDLAGETIVLNGSELTITSNVTIIGLGSGLLTIDADSDGDGVGDSQIFVIGDYLIVNGKLVPTDPEATGVTVLDVAISGMTLTKGAGIGVGPDYWGGAISATCTNLELDQVNIFDSVTTARGGAIFVNFGTLNYSNSLVDGNSSGEIGGAIWYRGMNSSSSSCINNVTFTNNTAASTSTYGGGAINVASTSLGSMSIVNSTFEYNKAESSFGGAIDFLAGTLSIDNTSFTSNKATEGGAIYAPAGVLNVSNSTFTENEADLGGAVYRKGYVTSGDSSSFSDVTFTGNRATAASSTFGGGAIFIPATSTETVTITDSGFDGNIAEGSLGGAIVLRGGVLEIQDSTFTENEAVFGGAIHASSSILDIQNTGFIKNKATEGGAIFSLKGKLDVSNDSSFTENEADLGGAVYRKGYVASGDSSSFSDVTFTGNMANSSAFGGGAIFIPATSTETVIITGSTFYGNKAEAGYGGAVNSRGAVLEVQTSSFSNNIAANGGAISAEFTEVEIQSSLFYGNEAVNGGAIYSMYGTLDVSTCSFEYGFSTNAAELGGAVYRKGKADSGNFSIFTDVLFEGNRATSLEFGGGAIFILATSTETMTLDHVTFYGNQTDGYGGGVYARAGRLELFDCMFTGNSTSKTGRGSGIAWTSKAFISISETQDDDTVLTKTSTADWALISYLDDPSEDWF